MSQIQQLPYYTRKRLPTIVKMLLEGHTQGEIALALKVRRETVARDLYKWRQSGGFEQFIKDEWMHMYAEVKDLEPVEAFRNLTKLMGKTMVSKVEQKVEQYTEIKRETKFSLKDLPEDEQQLVRNAIRIYLNRRSKREPSDIR